MLWFIISRVLLSVSANAVQKRLLLAGIRITPMWFATYALMLLPALLLCATQSLSVPREFWLSAILAGLLDAAGNLAMVGALRSTDLSLFGPLNAFRPVIALAFGWLFLRETPSALGGVGVVVTVAGALILFGKPALGEAEARRTWKVLALRLSGLSLSTLGAVFLKRAALVATAELTLGAWLICGLALLGATTLLRGANPIAAITSGLRSQAGGIALHAFLFIIMQWLTIRIFQGTMLSYSFVYFQLGMVLQVLTGGMLFQERSMGRRLSACGIMAMGSALVLWKG
jgi:uncharacterized membrane protein